LLFIKYFLSLNLKQLPHYFLPVCDICCCNIDRFVVFSSQKPYGGDFCVGYPANEIHKDRLSPFFGNRGLNKLPREFRIENRAKRHSLQNVADIIPVFWL